MFTQQSGDGQQRWGRSRQRGRGLAEHGTGRGEAARPGHPRCSWALCCGVNARRSDRVIQGGERWDDAMPNDVMWSEVM